MTPKGDFCCSRMRLDLEQKCDLHTDRYDCPDALISYNDDEYGLIIHDGGSSSIQIKYCPWCGNRLSAADMSSGENDV